MAYDPRAETIGLYKRAVAKTFDFSGRSRRTEFVTYYLLSLFAAMALILMVSFSTTSEAITYETEKQISTAIQCIIAIPMLALMVRRLHDQGWSGWWVVGPVGFLLASWGYELVTGKLLEDRFNPIVWGTIVLITLFALFYIIFGPGQEGENVYGPDPHYD